MEDLDAGVYFFYFFSCFINGSHSYLFKASWGLVQGDPLSPFFFTIVVEALNTLFRKAKKRGLIEGFSVGSEQEYSTHLNLMISSCLVL